MLNNDASVLVIPPYNALVVCLCMCRALTTPILGHEIPPCNRAPILDTRYHLAICCIHVPLFVVVSRQYMHDGTNIERDGRHDRNARAINNSSL